MPPDDLPGEANDKLGAGPRLRNDLRREALTRLNDVVVGVDSRAYEHASIAVGAFVGRTLDAADILHTELTTDDALPAGNANKLPVNVRRLYEDFITEAESIAIILPALMQQARLTQHVPTMQARLNRLYELIATREGFMSQIEIGRAALLKAQGARIQGRPIQFDQAQLARIIALADQAWRVRQELTVPVNLEELAKQLGADEAAAKQLTLGIGAASRTTAATADQLRRNLGAARVTQGMPAAEVILDSPRQSIDTWRRLITQGGPNERRRYARQLREGVSQFRQDFVQMRLYEEFEKYARQRMEKYIKANEPGMADRIAAWSGILGMETLAARLRNDPNSFREIFEEITKQMRSRFESIQKRDNGGMEQFIKLLEGIEKSGEVDQKTFEQRLTAYADVQEHSIDTLGAVQRWMVSENIGVMGNPAQGRANMLEQVTRVGDQTLVGFLRDQSPYGMFRQQSYYDARTNRLVLATPIQGPNGLMEHTTYHALNAGRTVAYSASTALAIYVLMTKVPYLSNLAPLRHLAIPVVLAEFTIAGAQNWAQSEQARVAGENIAKIVSLLQGPPPLNARDATTAANAFFASLVRLLHVTGPDTSADAPDRLLAIESHIYTNQLMVALGYPPYHRLGPTIIPASINDVPENRRSPELMQFLTVHFADIESDRKRTQEEREERNTLHVHVQEGLKKLGVQIAVQREDRVTQIIRGDLPSVVRQEDLLTAMRSKDFQPQMKKILAQFGGEGSAEQRLAILRLIGGLFLTMKRLRKIHDTFKNDLLGLPLNQQDPRVRREIILKMNRTYTLDGDSFTYAQVEQDLRRYVFETPASHFLAAADFLQARANQPTDDELSRHWHGAELGYFRSFAVNYLNTRHGVEGQRGGVGIEALRNFEDALDYARTHLRQGEAQMRRKIIEGREVPAGPGDGALAAERRVFTDAFLVALLGPDVLKQEQALLPEIDAVNKLRGPLNTARETVLKDLLANRAYENFNADLGIYTKRLEALQKVLTPHTKPIEEARALTRDSVVNADSQVQLTSMRHDELSQSLFASRQPRPVVFTRGMRADVAAGQAKQLAEQDMTVLEEMARLPTFCQDNSDYPLNNFVGVEFVRNEQANEETYVATFVYRRGDHSSSGYRYIQQAFVRPIEAGVPASFISRRGLPVMTANLTHLPEARRKNLSESMFKVAEERRGQEIATKIGRAGRLYCLASDPRPGQVGILESNAQGPTTLVIRSGATLTLIFIAADGSMTHATGNVGGQEDQKKAAAELKEWAARGYNALTQPRDGTGIFDLSPGEMKTAQSLEKTAFAAPRSADMTSIFGILQTAQSPITADAYINRIAAGAPGVAPAMQPDMQTELHRVFGTLLRNNTLGNQMACQALVHRVLVTERQVRNLPPVISDQGELTRAIFQIEQAMNGQ